MTLEERTQRYTSRRIAELRGTEPLSTLDRPTQRHIQRRIAEQRGATLPEEAAQEHPYIRRRLAELRKKSNETRTD